MELELQGLKPEEVATMFCGLDIEWMTVYELRQGEQSRNHLGHKRGRKEAVPKKKSFALAMSSLRA